MNILETQLLSRDTFREEVFKRDGYTCVVPGCGQPAQDSHHIIERRLWNNGGYYLANGASVCGQHHLAAERTDISVEEMRRYAGINAVILPPGIDGPVDKWGNFIFDDETRATGPLFFDESVQKILLDHLSEFRTRAKYPRTPHVHWSPGVVKTHGEPDDEILTEIPFRHNDMVLISEKLDGENCLEGNTKISFSDGSRRIIRHVVDKAMIGEYVLGMDDNGLIIPSKILSVFDNGYTQDWLKIYVKGSHGTSRTIGCTPNHKFMIPEIGYVCAKDLEPGMQVYVVNDTLHLSFLQEQVLLGKLLGDGSLNFPFGKGAIKNNTVASVGFHHAAKYREYIEWTMRALGPLCTGKSITNDISGYGSHTLVTTSSATHSIYEKFASMIINGKKSVPSWIANELTPISVAFWYMDDGSLNHSEIQRDRCTFSVCGFSETDCNVLVAGLDKLGIQSSLKEYDGLRYIDLNDTNTDKLMVYIAPYVPSVMQYKLSESYRGCPGWLPEHTEALSRQWLRKADILKIEKTTYHSPVGSGRIFDIETETHNYFANGILVHNCTMYYGEGNIHARSLSSNGPARSYVKAIHARIAYDIPPNFRICGENMQAVHSLKYENIPPFLVFGMFELRSSQWDCLAWDDVVEWCKLLELRHVPVLYEGPWTNTESIRKQFDHDGFTPSFYGPECEGYVIRHAQGFPEKDFNKHIAKYVRANHVVDGSQHWRNRVLEENKLRIA